MRIKVFQRVCSGDLTQLESVVDRLEDYTPAIPDATVQSILQRTGFQTRDPQVYLSCCSPWNNRLN